MSFVRRHIHTYLTGQWLKDIQRPSTRWQRWKANRELRKFQRMWSRMPPHEQLANFIDILDRHPVLRTAFKASLRLGRTSS